MTEIREHTPVTMENVEETCEYIFAPWVKAMGEDLRLEVNVLKFGKVVAYAETKVFFATSGKLVAHATNEFVF